MPPVPPLETEAQEAIIMLEAAAITTAIAIGIGLGFALDWILNNVTNHLADAV